MQIRTCVRFWTSKQQSPTRTRVQKTIVLPPMCITPVCLCASISNQIDYSMQLASRILFQWRSSIWPLGWWLHVLTTHWKLRSLKAQVGDGTKMAISQYPTSSQCVLLLTRLIMYLARIVYCISMVSMGLWEGCVGTHAWHLRHVYLLL